MNFIPCTLASAQLVLARAARMTMRFAGDSGRASGCYLVKTLKMMIILDDTDTAVQNLA